MILVNNIVNNGTSFSEDIFTKGLSIYEVIRIFKGHPIFLKDNIIRLNNSLKESNIPINAESLYLPDKLQRYIELAHITEGNLKYVLHFQSETPDEYIFRIPHAYPTEKDYRQGVPTMTYEAMRENPGVKYINLNLRTLADRLIEEHGVYEILLVDREGFITEGSRSNVFFIQNDTLYTSPLEYVLPGTSRKRVFDICKQENIRIVEKRVGCNNLNDYDVAFLTGTSPLILPIARVNEVDYCPDNTLLRKLMERYFALLES